MLNPEAPLSLPVLVDTHAHLHQEHFDADRDEVVRRAHEAGVSTIISIGINATSSQAVIELAAKYPGVFAAVGIQPNDCAEAQPGDWQQIVELCSQPRVVAIGETGLDRYWKDVPFDLQQDYFDRHLRLSQDRGLPLVIHTRECDADMLAMLREARQRGPLQGVMHSFTGAEETAAECIALGLYISFAGMVTFKKSDELRLIAKTVPADRILVETDSPYLSPHPLRGKRNEPANVVHTARVLAGVRGVSFEEFAGQTTENANRLFRLDERTT
jgi:TatD DNase family protein